ncbi:MAG TPA: hypothetical protein VL201_01915 [Patescibacteria group bacterium]|jgi:hypothetical protein|nr:hypothetical protein [Patescibacteria group bacterium]
MDYLFKNKQAFLSITLLFSTIHGMNMPGDLTPIKMSPCGRLRVSPLSISGSVKSEIYDDGVPTKEFFGDYNIATSVGAYILNTHSDNREGQGYFLDNASKQLSANKYLSFVTTFEKYCKTLGDETKEIIALFNVYYSLTEKKIDFFDIFKQLRVVYYFDKLKDEKVFARDEYTYLKKLPKQYTTFFNGKFIKIEKSNIELVLDEVKRDPEKYINSLTFLTGAMALTSYASDDFLQNLPNSFIQKYLISFAYCSIVTPIVIGAGAIETDDSYTVKTFESNPNESEIVD